MKTQTIADNSLRESDLKLDSGAVKILKESAEKTKRVLEATRMFCPSLSKDIGDMSSDFCLHSSIQDPDAPEDAPPRQSIEVRCFAFF